MIAWPVNVATLTVYLPGQSSRLCGTPLFISTHKLVDALGHEVFGAAAADW